jgi:hypothetical protein
VITNPRPGIWLAHRRDTYETLRAETPPALRAHIHADYIARPVPRDVGHNRSGNPHPTNLETCQAKVLSEPGRVLSLYPSMNADQFSEPGGQPKSWHAASRTHQPLSPGTVGT